MRKFLIQVFLFCAVLFVVDRSFLVFKRHETNLFYDIAARKVEKIAPVYQSPKRFDLIVLGSSHAQFGLSPEILASHLGKPCLNLAYGKGANVGLQLSLLQSILEKDPADRPKTLLYALDVFSLGRMPVHDDPLHAQLVGAFENPLQAKYANPYIKLYSRFIPNYIADVQKGKYSLPYFRAERTYDLKMFSTYTGFEISEYGWAKGFGYLNPKYVRYRHETFRPRPEALRDLDEIVKLCRDNGIELVMLHIPEHRASLQYKKKYEDFKGFMDRFSAENRLRYLDLNSPQHFPVGTDSLFFDSDHLNEQGATLFSGQVAKLL